MKRLSLLFTISSIITGAIFFQSCDTLESDTLPEDQNILNISGAESIIYIQPAGEGIINLSDKINSNNQVTLTINSKPVRGNVETMQDGIFKYIASASFTRGSDHVVFSVFNDNQEVDRDTITVKVIEDGDQLSCLATEDKFIIKDDNFIGTTYKFDVLSNDKICSQSFEINQIYDAKYGTSYFEDDFLYYQANSNAILEIPDLLVYEICQSIDGEIICSSATVYIKHLKTICSFAVNDDSLSVAYNGIDTIYQLPVFNNDTICIDERNSDYELKVLSVPEGMEADFVEDDKLKLFVPGNLSFPAVVGFHLPIKYQVCIAGEGCQSAIAKVFIEPEGCKPMAVNDSLFLEYNHNEVGATNTFTLDVLANDSICDQEFSLDISSSLKNGATVKLRDNKILFTHDSDKWGEYTFSYKLCDGNQNCTEANVYLNIAAK
jgi:hypothetical protein